MNNDRKSACFCLSFQSIFKLLLVKKTLSVHLCSRGKLEQLPRHPKKTILVCAFSPCLPYCLQQKPCKCHVVVFVLRCYKLFSCHHIIALEKRVYRINIFLTSKLKQCCGYSLEVQRAQHVLVGKQKNINTI